VSDLQTQAKWLRPGDVVVVRGREYGVTRMAVFGEHVTLSLVSRAGAPGPASPTDIELPAAELVQRVAESVSRSSVLGPIGGRLL
jgi:hypothetical protein